MTFRLLLILLFFSISSYAEAEITQDSIWIRKNYNKIERMVSMRDGARLFTAIYIPRNSSETHPLLIIRTPYSCAPYGENQFRKFWNTYHKAYLREHYIMVYQDVRGRYKSEGEFVDVRPFNPNKRTNKDIDEASDTYDTIEWLLKNINGNNGKAGVMGISYPGFYSTMAALSNHPALKAVSPQAPVTDWFEGDDFHHNGAFMMMDAFEFYSEFGVPRPKPSELYNKGFARKDSNAYQFYLEAGTLKNMTTRFLADSIPFWNDLMNHPNNDSWWQARNTRNFVTDIKPAMLIVGGLFDAEDCFGAWNLYKAIEKKNPASTYNKLIMGPWFHGTWEGRADGSNLGKIKFGALTSEYYQQQFEIPFFQYYLKGIGTTNNISEANVFITGENQWRQFDAWPPKVDYKPIYMQPNRGLSFLHPRPLGYRERPDSGLGWSEYISDPENPVPHEGGIIHTRTREYMAADQRFASGRSDVLNFTSETLLQDLLLAGPVVADLMVSITGTDADFVVKLIDVFPGDMAWRDTLYAKDSSMNGYQMLVRGEIMRGKYRNSLSKPEPFVANKITRVKFTLPDIAHKFLKGHRLMIQVQSSWFPLSDRNPQKFIDIYHAQKEDFQKATIRIYYTEGIASKLILPVLE